MTSQGWRGVWKLALVLVVLLGMMGCAHTVGRPFEGEQSKNIKSGITTKKEVLQLPGEPHNRNIMPGGREAWQYLSSVSSSAPTAAAFIPLYGSLPKNYSVSGNLDRLNIVFSNDIVSDCQRIIRTSKGRLFDTSDTTITTKCGDEQ